MKKILIISFILFAITNLSFSQWVSQFNSNGYLEDVLFINENTGFVTSSFGSSSAGGFYMTTNGGDHWIILDSLNNSTQALQYVGNKLLCFCLLGIFLESTNSGQSWNKKSHPIDYINSAYFINEMTGWIGGGGSIAEIYKTTNGGDDWIYQYGDSIEFCYIKSMYFLNEFTGIATEQVFPTMTTDYSGKIIKTNNGGVNWEITYQGGFNDKYLWDASYNGNTFYAIDAKLPNGRNNVLLS
ncbi:MAG: hypothetical protein M3R36_13705 [Bacteroidota bacterium]|nr:hypothetical protein [Bacteroidota bacterium]